MDRLASLLALFLLTLEGAAQPTPVQRPNVILILADDLGYADIGVHGCRDIPTPHLDALAARGVRCSNGYSSHPFCSPMRAGLMAGRYQHRFGYVSNVPYDPQNIHLGLPTSEKTIAQRLQEVGYRTGMSGKWHLGASHLHHPNKRGFDFFYGFLGGGHDYFEVDLRRPMGEGYAQPLDRNGKPENLETYLTDALTREAVGFIGRNQEHPFFFYLAYNAPHTPMQAPEDLLVKFLDIADPKRRAYAAMVHAMDRGIGEVMAALDRHGLRETTLVFFLSDNGGPSFANASSNAPLRGDKGDVYEGGIRVPFLISWPGTLPEGAVYDHPVISLDISRTALEVGQARLVPKLDGVNLIPFLSGQDEAPPHQALFWRKDDGTAWAVRSGNTKLLMTRDRSAEELYQLDSDLAEQRNVAKLHPDQVAAARSLYAAWNESNTAPLFPSFREYHARKGRFYKELPYEPSESGKPRR